MSTVNRLASRQRPVSVAVVKANLDWRATSQQSTFSLDGVVSQLNPFTLVEFLCTPTHHHTTFG